MVMFHNGGWQWSRIRLLMMSTILPAAFCSATESWVSTEGDNARTDNAIGVRGDIGCGTNPTLVERLEITKPGRL